MRLVPLILTMMMFASASAQSDIWTTLSGRADNYANQRAAVQAAIQEFSTKLQAALASPNDGLADHYPSQRSAVYAVVDRFVSELKSSPEFDIHRTRIILIKLSQQQSGMNPLPEGNVNVSGSWSGIGFNGQMSQAITDNAASQSIRTAQDRLQHVLPRVKITLGTKPDPTTPNVVCLSLGVGEVEMINRFEPFQAQACQGRLMATSSLGGREQQSQTRFENQAWADDFGSFLHHQPRQNWVIGRSNSLCSNPVEAVRVACEDAVSQMATEARTRASMNRVYFDDDTLKASAMSRLQSQGVTDKFVQHVDNGTEFGWRAMVLVQSEAPPVQMSWQRNYVNSTGPSSSRTWSSFGSCIAMMVVVTALFAFLRLIIRDRSAARFPIGSFALLAVIGIFVLLVALFFVRMSFAPTSRATSVSPSAPWSPAAEN